MHTFTLDYWQDGSWFVGRLRENPAVMTLMETEPPPTAASVHSLEITV